MTSFTRSVRPKTDVRPTLTPIVERPILLGTRFEIPGVGRGLTSWARTPLMNLLESQLREAE